MESKRVHSKEEMDLVREKKEQDNRIEENKKIRCPCCKKNQYYDQYLANPQLGTLVCSNCGVLFIDQAKIKIIKKNIARQTQRTQGKIILPK